MMMARILRFGIPVSLLAGLSLLVVTGATAADPRLDLCGANAHENKVLATFELTSARQFWSRFPHAGMAPELEVDTPAFVVVFNGPATHPLVGAPAGPGTDAAMIVPATRDRVVCVVVGGIVNIYSGVDLTGFAP